MAPPIGQGFAQVNLSVTLCNTPLGLTPLLIGLEFLNPDAGEVPLLLLPFMLSTGVHCTLVLTRLSHVIPPLSPGDRLVKVNGESVIGKTYSQVIGLIQNR